MSKERDTETFNSVLAAITKSCTAGTLYHPEQAARDVMAIFEQHRAALKYGRDCVMESFEHVKDTDDQVMADARLQAIDAALRP